MACEGGWDAGRRDRCLEGNPVGIAPSCSYVAPIAGFGQPGRRTVGARGSSGGNCSALSFRALEVAPALAAELCSCGAHPPTASPDVCAVSEQDLACFPFRNDCPARSVLIIVASSY